MKKKRTKIKLESIEYLSMLLIFLSIVVVGLDGYLTVNYFISSKIVLGITYTVITLVWVAIGVMNCFNLRRSLRQKKRNKYLNSKYEDIDF